MNVLERRDQVKAMVDSLSPLKRLLFAAGCAQRLGRFLEEAQDEVAEVEVFEDLLEAIWNPDKWDESEGDLKALYADALEHFPDYEDFEEDARIRLFAIAAVISALGDFTGDEPNGASDAALAAWEAAHVLGGGLAVAREVRRQNVDFENLKGSDEIEQLVSIIRDRARQDAW